MNHSDLRVRAAAVTDLPALADFACSSGTLWEDLVEQQIRGPLPRRYLGAPPRFDGRMLVGHSSDGTLLVVGAHHVEPTLTPDVGYAEVVAVARSARGTLIELPAGDHVSLGQFMLLVILRQMRELGRHRRTFVRVDRRNVRSLALCDRVGLVDERDDLHDASIVQRWGELPE